MKLRYLAPVWALVFGLAGSGWAQSDPLSERERSAAAEDYARYCALCHGENREGHANDHAPSLRSQSLFQPGNDLFIFRSIAYGRPGTPMAAYRDESGGPMRNREITRLVSWLYEEVGTDPRYDENGARVRMSYDRVEGDAGLGAQVYARECAQCHGVNGEGGVGTALGNPVTLVFASDGFLRYAIENGRDGTPMPAFKDRLSTEEINAVTAYLRSRASGWDVEQPVAGKPPGPEDYVLNPEGPAPEFELTDGRYVLAADLNDALNDGARMVLLDTRVTSWWQMGHIEGAIPVPYYSDFDEVAGNLPDDGTWIVAYCECPRAAAESVVRRLRGRGFQNTAVLWEGIQGWAAQGFPIVLGEVESVSVTPEE